MFFAYLSLFTSDETITENCPIELDKPQDSIRQDPYSLPQGFHWNTLDIADPLVVCIAKIECVFCF